MRYPRQSRLSGTGYGARNSGRILHARGRQVICPNRAGPIIHHHRNRLVKPLGGSAVHSRWDDLTAGWLLNEVSDGSGAIERADILDSYNLTDNNTVASRAGLISNAADFVAVDATTLTNANGSDFCFLSGGGIRTISLWIETDAVIGARILMENTRVSGLTRVGGFQLWLNAKIAYLTIIDSGGAYRSVNTGNDIASTATWYHIVGWYDPGTSKSYIAVDDGIPYAFGATFTLPAAAGGAIEPLTFGAQSTVGGVNFDGGTDIPAIFSTVKDAAWRTGMNNGGAGVEYPD